VAMLPATPALDAVAMLPATPALSVVPMLPTTEVRRAVRRSRRVMAVSLARRQRMSRCSTSARWLRAAAAAPAGS
jgi:hypothetical protein